MKNLSLRREKFLSGQGGKNSWAGKNKSGAISLAKETIQK